MYITYWPTNRLEYTNEFGNRVYEDGACATVEKKHVSDPKELIIFPRAFNKKSKCGCLEALFIHEISHKAGYQHHTKTKNTFDIANDCFPNCSQRRVNPKP
jgi:hypothetical protein